MSKIENDFFDEVEDEQSRETIEQVMRMEFCFKSTTGSRQTRLCVPYMKFTQIFKKFVQVMDRMDFMMPVECYDEITVQTNLGRTITKTFYPDVKNMQMEELVCQMTDSCSTGKSESGSYLYSKPVHIISKYNCKFVALDLDQKSYLNTLRVLWRWITSTVINMNLIDGSNKSSLEISVYDENDNKLYGDIDENWPLTARFRQLFTELYNDYFKGDNDFIISNQIYKAAISLQDKKSSRQNFSFEDSHIYEKLYDKLLKQAQKDGVFDSKLLYVTELQDKKRANMGFMLQLTGINDDYNSYGKLSKYILDVIEKNLMWEWRLRLTNYGYYDNTNILVIIKLDDEQKENMDKNDTAEYRDFTRDIPLLPEQKFLMIRLWLMFVDSDLKVINGVNNQSVYSIVGTMTRK